MGQVKMSPWSSTKLPQHRRCDMAGPHITTGTLHERARGLRAPHVNHEVQRPECCAVCVASSCARWAVRRCGNIAVRGYLVVFREAVQVGVLHREEVLERSLADRHHDGY